MRSESEGSEAGGESEGNDLEEGSVALDLTLVVGEDDVNVGELGAVGGVELELSGLSCLGVAVLNAGEGNPEVSHEAIAVLPLVSGDGVRRVG